MAGRPLRPATRRRLGRPSPHQQADRPRAHPQPKKLSTNHHAAESQYPVLAPVSKCYPRARGRLPTCYSPVRHSSTRKRAFPFDLHVLSTPPAFVLSQDQTLHRMPYNQPTPKKGQHDQQTTRENPPNRAGQSTAHKQADKKSRARKCTKGIQATQRWPGVKHSQHHNNAGSNQFGTDFRYAVEFSKNRRTPSTASRPSQGQPEPRYPVRSGLSNPVPTPDLWSGTQNPGLYPEDRCPARGSSADSSDPIFRASRPFAIRSSAVHEESYGDTNGRSNPQVSATSPARRRR